MRVLLIILALAYWGVALLAQSYLSRGVAAPVSSAAEVSLTREAPAAELVACDGPRENDLLVAASFSSDAAPSENLADC